MKTLEQVKEHLATTYYDCSDKICGFIVGCGLKDPKEVIKFLKDDKFVYNFDDFLEWFDDEENEEDCDGCDCNCSKSGISDETSSSTEEQLLELFKLSDELLVNLINVRDYATANIILRNIFDGLGHVSEKEEPKEKPLKYQGESRDNIVAEYKKKKEMISELYKLNKDYNSDSVICAICGLEDKSRILSKMLEERIDE